MTLIPGAFPKTPQKPARSNVDVNNTSHNEYKKISIPKPCFCGTCGSLTDEQILKIYNSDLIIAENNSLVFQVFGKEVVK